MPDLTINFTIPQAKASEALAAFLLRFPNITGDPLLWDGDPLTDAQWIKRRIRMWINETINEGRRHLHRANNPEPVDADFAEE